MEDRLKELMQELGNAINESLSDSDRIAAAIGEIKRAGYDVFLVLEATIGFQKREDDGEENSGTRLPSRLTRPKNDVVDITSGTAHINWSAQDRKFLRAFKILAEDE